MATSNKSKGCSASACADKRPNKYFKVGHAGMVSLDLQPPGCLVTHLDTCEKVALPLKGGVELVFDDDGMGAVISGLDEDASGVEVTLLEDTFKWEVVEDREGGVRGGAKKRRVERRSKRDGETRQCCATI